MVKEKKQEFTLRISKANKTQMIVILYDMVLEYLQNALDNYKNHNKKEYKAEIQNAKNCIDELINSLNYEYEIASVLRSLYYFYKRELSTAAIMEKEEKIVPIMEMIKELKNSFEIIAKQDSSAPIMENAQSVYAGLTYGKDCLNVDLSDQSSNRGFRV